MGEYRAVQLEASSRTGVCTGGAGLTSFEKKGSNFGDLLFFALSLTGRLRGYTCLSGVEGFIGAGAKSNETFSV
jgi:hypothetical protein